MKGVRKNSLGAILRGRVEARRILLHYVCVCVYVCVSENIWSVSQTHPHTHTRHGTHLSSRAIYLGAIHDSIQTGPRLARPVGKDTKRQAGMVW